MTAAGGSPTTRPERLATAPPATMRARWWLLPGIVVFVVTFGFRYLSYAGFPNDHFVHLARAQQMLLGAWPVRDFVDPGMPLMYAVSAAGLFAFGHNLFGEALVVFGAFALAAALTFESTRAATGSALLAMAAAFLATAAYPRSYSYPKLLLYATAIVMCWRCLSHPTGLRCASLGALVAVAFLFRHDHGVFIGGAAVLTVLLARTGFKPAFAGVAALGAAVLLLLAPWMALVQTAAGVPAYVRSALEFSRMEAVQTRMDWPRFNVDPTAGLWTREVALPSRALVHVRWVPDLPPDEQARRERALGLEMVEHHEGRTWRYTVERSQERGRALLGDPAVEDTSGLERLRLGWGERAAELLTPFRGHPGPGLPIGQNSEALLYYVMLGLPLAAMIVIARRPGADAPMPDASARMGIVILLAFCTGAAFLRDPLRERLADAIVPATVLGAWMAAAAWRGARRLSRPGRFVARTAVLTFVCLVAGSVVVVGSTSEQLNRIGPITPAGLTGRAAQVTTALWQGYSTSFLPGSTAFDLQPAFAWLEECTESSDRFSYIGFAPDAYFFARRGFAGGQVVFIGEYYSSPAEQRLTLDRFRRDRVPLVLLPENNAAEFHRRFPLVANYVSTAFFPVATIELSGNRRAAVLVNRGMTPTRTYQPLGWPCFR